MHPVCTSFFLHLTSPFSSWGFRGSPSRHHVHSNLCLCLCFQDALLRQLLCLCYGACREQYGKAFSQFLMKLFGLKPERQMGLKIITDFPRKGLQKEKLIWVEERKNQQQKEVGRPRHLGFHISTGRADAGSAEIHPNHCLHYSIC